MVDKGYTPSPNVQSMDPKSHAVIDGPFDRDPDKSVWTTYYVDPKCKWWVDVKSLAVTKPFVVILEDFVKIVGPDAELKIIARADKPEFHEDYHQLFKDYPRLPAQVYAFHPPSGSIRAVADGFERPNGVVLSLDMLIFYITDTGFASGEPEGTHKLDDSRPGTIYAYTVEHSSDGSSHSTHPPVFTNRRPFAFANCGMPDGVKCDTEGNVYAGCGTNTEL
ncbi:hypothetical protein BN14_12150 [Rhizoctonia solani AG-1 IB]|uniref:Uncharacterized protein n=1 Tax=Thanatephorus cucumeris (strain AG1-IB / isolate 7/3/14) TaxID=1108050 RepID=M5CF70_THACB|nr:hypothetical protein BN14_12150 [Rhizoctonia solani AG-1 IB]